MLSFNPLSSTAISDIFLLLIDTGISVSIHFNGIITKAVFLPVKVCLGTSNILNINHIVSTTGNIVKTEQNIGNITQEVV